jgi:SAM-dependent methyltransferase
VPPRRVYPDLVSVRTLDAAITVNTIYFVSDLGKAFTELARVLSPSGRAVVGLNDPAAMAAMPFTARNFIIRPVEAVVTALADAGFTAAPKPDPEDRRQPAHGQ